MIKTRKTKRMLEAIIIAALTLLFRAKTVLAENRAEGFVDTAVKILIVVVIGALVLVTLYALFGDIIMPKVQQSIENMFNYSP